MTKKDIKNKYPVSNYKRACNLILEEFCKYMGYEDPECWLVAGNILPPREAFINDDIWMIDDMVYVLMYEIPCIKAQDWHGENLQRAEAKKQTINLYSYHKNGCKFFD